MRVGVDPGHGRVVHAGDQSAIAVALAHEGAGVDAARKPAHRAGIEPGQLRDARADALDRRAVTFAAQQVLQVFARRVALDLAQRLAVERRVRLARGAAIEGSRDTQASGEWRPLPRQPKSSTGETMTSAADRDALLVELGGELRRAEAAIAFAGDEFLRGLAAVLLDPFAHEGREHVDVAIDRPELLAHFVARP